MHNMRRITRFEVSAVDNDVYLENGEARITNPDIKVCLACDVGDLENKTEEIILHHKHKRCLAMAWWCEAEVQKCLTQQGAMIGFPWTDRFQYLQGQITHYSRWHRIWLEVAEKFKEAK